MKKQIVVIHGAEAFDTYEAYIAFLTSYRIENLDDLKSSGWKNTLQKELGDAFDVILPRMPNSMNARYLEWKIWFDKLVPLLKENTVLIGHSMGGIFLVKYLSENILSIKPAGVFLIAAPHDGEGTQDQFADFVLQPDISNVRAQSDNLHFYHSTDDPVVPFLQMEKYKKIFPTAHFHIFQDRQHFNQEEFPEIVADLLK